MRIKTPCVLDPYTEDCFAGRVPLEDAFRIAQHDMVTWVAAVCALDPIGACQFVTQAVESPLANVCDTNYTSIAKMPKRYLPGRAYDGIHAQLRELAAAL
jgi:amidase